jgi:hypothetical protein
MVRVIWCKTQEEADRKNKARYQTANLNSYGEFKADKCLAGNCGGYWYSADPIYRPKKWWEVWR